MNSPSLILERPSHQPCRTALIGRVGTQRAALSDDELEFHIEDSQWQYLTAYERFELHGNPADRDEALLHLHRMNVAILARSPAVKAARHAAFERELDERYCYFRSAAAQELGRMAA